MESPVQTLFIPGRLVRAGRGSSEGQSSLFHIELELSDLAEGSQSIGMLLIVYVFSLVESRLVARFKAPANRDISAECTVILGISIPFHSLLGWTLAWPSWRLNLASTSLSRRIRASRGFSTGLR